MADKKISALTPATTPLAGTEVLPIVESGATKKVSVDNLTAGKAVSALSLTATNLKTSPTTANLDISGTTVAAGGSNSNIDITLTPKGTGFTTTTNFNAATVILNAATSSTTYGPLNVNGDIATYTNGKLKLGPDQGGGAELYYDGSGNLHITPRSSFNTKLTAGNLLIGAANQGIEFSGNSNVLWRCGSGSPETVVTAPVGSLFTRTDGGAGTTLYVKESGAGNTGWVAK